MKTSILLLGLSIFISYAQAESDAKAPESPAAPEGDLEETVPTQHQNLTPLPLKRLEFKKIDPALYEQRRGAYLEYCEIRQFEYRNYLPKDKSLDSLIDATAATPLEPTIDADIAAFIAARQKFQVRGDKVRKVGPQNMIRLYQLIETEDATTKSAFEKLKRITTQTPAFYSNNRTARGLDEADDYLGLRYYYLVALLKRQSALKGASNTELNRRISEAVTSLIGAIDNFEAKVKSYAGSNTRGPKQDMQLSEAEKSAIIESYKAKILSLKGELENCKK